MAIFPALLFLGACGGGEKEAQEHDSLAEEHLDGEEIELTERQMETVGIRLGAISSREIATGIKATGELAVNPQDMAEVSAAFSGIVKRIDVKEGERVRAGQIVAMVENPSLIENQQQYSEAVSSLELAAKERDRQERLAREGAGVRKNLEKAEADYVSARSREQSLRQLLLAQGISPDKVKRGEYVSVSAVKTPISGVVNRINCSTGSYAETSRPLMTVTDNSKLFASLRIFEKDLNRIHEGQRVDLMLINGGEIEGRVTEINRTISPETKSMAVKVAVNGGEGTGLIPGMAVTAYINSGEAKADVLPEDAVVMRGGKEFIYLLEHEDEEDGEKVYHFIPTEVVTGKRQQGWVEVTPLSPIPADAVLVVSKAFYLASIAADHGEHNH